MKKISIILLIVLLSTILFFQYSAYKRYNPPGNYNYPVNDSIDINFYKPLLVQQYYENAYQIGSFARQLWFNEGIDIIFLDERKSESKNAIAYYKTLLATTKIIEQKLVRSGNLKKQGYNNSEIELIFEKGGSPEKIRRKKAMTKLMPLNHLKAGDIGEGVWLLQKILISKGYKIPQDGNFGLETYNALKEFQEKNDLYPSGSVTITTLKRLVK
ncbi:MAG: peptidoglycan-binding protein [Cyclobacteriaceae bacterium]|nr:peptidoglycan-binding protein [Cyclobacteriaceae bacterium]